MIVLDTRDGVFEAVAHQLGIGFTWQHGSSRSDKVIRVHVPEMATQVPEHIFCLAGKHYKLVAGDLQIRRCIRGENSIRCAAHRNHLSAAGSMAITQEDIFIGSYYRTQFGEVREVTGIVGSNVVYTPHRRTAASVVALPSQDISLIRFAHDAQKEVERP